MKHYLTFFLTITSFFPVLPQTFFVGARSAGLANTTTSIGDVHSVFNNPGSLGLVEKETAASGYATLYQVEGWNSVFASLNKRVANGYAGIGFFRFGDDLFNMSMISTGFGHKLGIGSLGASIVYHQLQIEGFGTRSFVRIDFGGVANLSKMISISAGIKNLTQSQVSKITEEYYPTLIFLGFGYTPTVSLKVMGQIDKTLEAPETIKVGLEYQLKALRFRIGIQSSPVLVTTGLGFDFKKLNFDYAFQHNTTLGTSQVIGLSYRYLK